MMKNVVRNESSMLILCWKSIKNLWIVQRLKKSLTWNKSIDERHFSNSDRLGII